MNSELVPIFALALTAMANPSLLAAVTVMLLLPSPRRLMAGYLLGAYLTSIGVGLVIVFAAAGSSGQSTSQHKISPVEDIVLGVLALIIAFVLGTGRDRRLTERRREHREAKRERDQAARKPTESLPLRLLGRGDPRITFVVGMVLSFPGVSYLIALNHIRKLGEGTTVTVALVVAFCVIQMLLLELPLLGYLFASDRTDAAVASFRDWTARRGRTAMTIVAAVLGALLLIRGVITLL